VAIDHFGAAILDQKAASSGLYPAIAIKVKPILSASVSLALLKRHYTYFCTNTIGLIQVCCAFLTLT
jgi:hypothetical protein